MRSIVGSGLLLTGLFLAFVAALAPIGAAGAATAQAPAVSEALAPGETLFVAKGCVVCHSVSDRGLHAAIASGPDLALLESAAGSRRPGMTAAAYVAESLRAPEAFTVPGYASTFRMPALGLSEDEVAALTAYLLGR